MSATHRYNFNGFSSSFTICYINDDLSSMKMKNKRTVMKCNKKISMIQGLEAFFLIYRQSYKKYCTGSLPNTLYMFFLYVFF